MSGFDAPDQFAPDLGPPVRKACSWGVSGDGLPDFLGFSFDLRQHGRLLAANMMDQRADPHDLDSNDGQKVHSHRLLFETNTDAFCTSVATRRYLEIRSTKFRTVSVQTYSCSPFGRRPDPRMNRAGFFAAAVRVATVIAAAAIKTVCPSTLAARNV